MSCTVVIHGFPAELARREAEIKPAQRSGGHVIRGGLAYRAYQGLATPRSEANSSVCSTSSTPSCASRTSLDAVSASCSPSSSLTFGGPEPAPNRLKAIYSMAASTMAALLAPKSGHGARIRPPTGCCR